MLRPAITQLISESDSCYSLVIGVAKRAREIADELADKKILEQKPVKTSVEELASGKYKIIAYRNEPEIAEQPKQGFETDDSPLIQP